MQYNIYYTPQYTNTNTSTIWDIPYVRVHNVHYASLRSNNYFLLTNPVMTTG
jgi:hypothetical protein